MVRPSPKTVLFFLIFIITALPGPVPGSAFSQNSRNGQIQLFKGSLPEAINAATAIVVARPAGRQFSSSPTDRPSIHSFIVLDALKGVPAGTIKLRSPGQTMPFYPSPDKSYLLFLTGGRDNSYSIISHSLSVLLAFEVSVDDRLQGRLPPHWKPFTVNQLRDLIHTSEHQSD
ncbi:hypothetical protein [Emcibacter sp.]|uniref:hypothetical protein n=1 Tax=Emcibacter sp. TaxID=1979954 RepID=UPI002AA6AC7D|nr:hypothetical protein [Emcibacter sp.]